MDKNFRIFALATLVCIAPLVTACVPDDPRTQLSWDVNDRAAARTAEPARKPAATYASNDTARTYVYQGDDYAVPAPKPRPQPPTYQSSAYQAPASYTQPVSGSVAFEWPATGKVISSFGATSNGARNDGINIATAMDAPIRAAAGGTVTYAGNELKGYGNLMLIKHADGYVTAYAHADRMLVGRGDTVTKGQVIGYSGSTGDVDSPQLHFEIRHDTAPVNPQALLMARNS